MKEFGIFREAEGVRTEKSKVSSFVLKIGQQREGLLQGNLDTKYIGIKKLGQS